MHKISNKHLPTGQQLIHKSLLSGESKMLSTDIDISLLEKEALDGKLLKCMPAEFYQQFEQDQLSLFCHKQGFYGLPTEELVQSIKALINHRTAIEIGSGNGCLGRALGIHRTDNKMQTWPEIKQKYKEGNIPTIFYPNDVKKINYKKAILKYKPQVVIASWVTQIDKNVYGIDEEWVLDNCKTYIHFGHSKVHAEKKINDIPHITFDDDNIVKHGKWLYSRSFRQKEILQVWR